MKSYELHFGTGYRVPTVIYRSLELFKQVCLYARLRVLQVDIVELPQAAQAILHQHAVQGDVTELQQTLIRWVASSRQPTVDPRTLHRLLQVTLHFATLYTMSRLWNCYVKIINFIYFSNLGSQQPMAHRDSVARRRAMPGGFLQRFLGGITEKGQATPGTVPTSARAHIGETRLPAQVNLCFPRYDDKSKKRKIIHGS